MTKGEARKIGGRKGLISAATGIVVAYLIMAMILGRSGYGLHFGWIADVSMKLSLALGIVIMLVNGYLWGQLAGIGILIDKSNFLWVGILCGIGALLTTAFLSGWPGFLQEGMPWKYSFGEGFRTYVVQPFFWVALFGLIPAGVVGVWMGWSIKKYQNVESESI